MNDVARIDAASDRFARVWAVLRLVVVVLVGFATAEQVRLALEVAAVTGANQLIVVGRLFTFFTVLSNTALMIVFGIAGVRALRRRETVDPRWLATLIASMSTYMLVTGLVYNLVLRSAGDGDIMGGWSNGVHHVIAPLFVLADVIWAPRRRALAWSAIPWGLVFPLVWLAFTLASGPYRVATDTGRPPWYPYPFLDPAVAGGYAGVGIWAAAIAFVIAGLMTIVVVVGRWRGRRAEDRRAVSSRRAPDASNP